MDSALILVAPGAFIAALICFRRFRIGVLWLIAFWVLIYGVILGTARAQEPVVACQLSITGEQMLAGAGWCDVFQDLKQNVVNDLRQGNHYSFGTCMRTMAVLYPETTDQKRGYICQLANSHGTRDYALQK